MRPSQFRPQSVLSEEGRDLLNTESLLGLLEARGVRVERTWHDEPKVITGRDLSPEATKAPTRPLFASVMTTERSTVAVVIPAEYTTDRMTMGAYLRAHLLRSGQRLAYVLAYGDE